MNVRWFFLIPRIFALNSYRREMRRVCELMFLLLVLRILAVVPRPKRIRTDVQFLPILKGLRERFQVAAAERRMGAWQSNPYFHASWYRARHGVKRPLWHYLQNAHRVNVEPNPFFDSSYYRSRYMRGNEGAALTPLEHFWKYGRTSNAFPHPAWVEDLYVASNFDVSRQISAGQYLNGYEHFCVEGFRRAIVDSWLRVPVRIGNHTVDFVERDYLGDNKDVRASIAMGEFENGLSEFFQKGYYETIRRGELPYSRTRIPRKIRVVDGCGKLSNRARSVAIFAHYDPNATVDEYVFRYIRWLKESGVDVIFVSAGIREVDEKQIKEMCIAFIEKNDAGRDFGSWIVALEHFGIGWFDDYEYLLFVNDSVYCPVVENATVLSTIAALGFDFWGICDSRQDGGYHIQSWFLGFGRKARIEVLPKFLAIHNERPYLSKTRQIRDYEYGLTQIAIDAGCAVGAYCSIDDARDEILPNPAFNQWDMRVRYGLEACNPTHHLWDFYVKRLGCPAIKLELLRDNPLAIDSVKDWPAVVGTDVAALINGHMTRVNDSAFREKNRLREPLLVDEREDLRVLEVLAGMQGFGRKRLVLLAHYDQDQLLAPYVSYMIRSFVANQCDVVLVSAGLDKASRKDAANLCSEVIIKTGVGRDFGSWFVAMEHLGKERICSYKSVIWMNDSVYFPLYPMENMFSQMEKMDFWGIVDSTNLKWHVMSWFWCFNKKIIEEVFFDWYIKKYNPNYTKWDQIRNYEMLVPEMFCRMGYQCGSYVEEFRVASKVLGRDFAPKSSTGVSLTHHLWDVGIVEYKNPGLKVELLRDNPLEMDFGIGYSKVKDVILNNTDYDAELVFEHLRRIKRH
jgi:lipopolysaccharide biosynthesis protein